VNLLCADRVNSADGTRNVVQLLHCWSNNPKTTTESYIWAQM